MCKTITTRYLGCGGNHIETASKDCTTAILNRSKGGWFDCTHKECNHWSDAKCPVCRKTPAKKLARVLKNPVHTIRFFTEKNVNIMSFDQDEETSDDGYGSVSPVIVKKEVYRELPYWKMMQHVKIEIALITDRNAMTGRATPGEIIGRILD